MEMVDGTLLPSPGTLSKETVDCATIRNESSPAVPLQRRNQDQKADPSKDVPPAEEVASKDIAYRRSSQGSVVETIKTSSLRSLCGEVLVARGCGVFYLKTVPNLPSKGLSRCFRRDVVEETGSHSVSVLDRLILDWSGTPISQREPARSSRDVRHRRRIQPRKTYEVSKETKKDHLGSDGVIG